MCHLNSTTSNYLDVMFLSQNERPSFTPIYDNRLNVLNNSWPFFDIFSHRCFFLNISISLSDSVHHFSLAVVHCIVFSVMIVITVFRFRGYVSLLCLFQIALQTCYFTMTFDNPMFSSVYV